MADEIFDNVDPNAPAEVVSSRTEIELRAVEAKRDELLAQLAAENAIKAMISPAIRSVAIALHSKVCPSDHATMACTWYTDLANADSVESADWTEVAHQRWLGIAAIGIATMVEQGWTVTEPQS